MPEFNFNNKTFSLLENSVNGKVNSETLFKYKQEGNLVTADYSGGTIKYGKIIANLSNNTLHMLYQCITTENELKAGKAIAEISLAKNKKIKLKLNWEWLGEKNENGVSEYIEN
ncbi:hypothetical protein [Algibacter sp. R77976]|uniref:hypothetical protein n=1 Tax=Algibacter sp. R77976 TaxID=3093873 RepID=UPI0037C5FCD8